MCSREIVPPVTFSVPPVTEIRLPLRAAVLLMVPLSRFSVPPVTEMTLRLMYDSVPVMVPPLWQSQMVSVAPLLTVKVVFWPMFSVLLFRQRVTSELIVMSL